MATGTRSSVRLEEQIAMLIRRMDELTLQVKNIKEDLTARVVRTEEGQCQMGAALRDIEASLLKQAQESILQEIASEDRGSHDQDVPDVDGQLPRGLCSSATQKPIPFDGKISWDSYKTQFEMLSYMNQWKEPEKVAIWRSVSGDRQWGF